MIRKLNLRRIFISLLLVISGLFMLNPVYANNSYNPHTTQIQAGSSTQQCLACHKTLSDKLLQTGGKYIIPDMSGFIKNATTMCTDCHGEDSSSHIIGVTPDYTVPADLPLNYNNQITCLTCHYIHGSLQSEKPMASTSFMDHLFNRERLYKSYMLRRNNAQGELCLACHGM